VSGRYTVGITTGPSIPRHAKAKWSVRANFGPQLNEKRCRNTDEERTAKSSWNTPQYHERSASHSVATHYTYPPIYATYYNTPPLDSVNRSGRALHGECGRSLRSNIIPARWPTDDSLWLVRTVLWSHPWQYHTRRHLQRRHPHYV
jgi:hypothetical protein